MQARPPGSAEFLSPQFSPFPGQLAPLRPSQTARGPPPFPLVPTDLLTERPRREAKGEAIAQSPPLPALRQSCLQPGGAASASAPRPGPARPRPASPSAPGGGRGPGRAPPAAAAAPGAEATGGPRRAEDRGSPRGRGAPGQPCLFQHHQLLPLPPSTSRVKGQRPPEGPGSRGRGGGGARRPPARLSVTLPQECGAG